MTYNNDNRKRNNNGGSQGGNPRKGFNGASGEGRKPRQLEYHGFEPRTPKQQAQADVIDANDIAFCVGPAGTGKTHVAMAKAVEALQSGTVEKILIARPALESGEKLGYQPGDQNAKMAPYMRPLYDELDKAFGEGSYQRLLDDGRLEIVPIGFMRGRTFAKAFIIVDEAQNCKFEQLKMAITRLGEGSKMVITGDPDQSDFEPKELSGLKPIVEAAEGIEGIGMHYYTAADVMRHPTVQRFVEKLEKIKDPLNTVAPTAPGNKP